MKLFLIKVTLYGARWNKVFNTSCVYFFFFCHVQRRWIRLTSELSYNSLLVDYDNGNYMLQKWTNGGYRTISMIKRSRSNLTNSSSILDNLRFWVVRGVKLSPEFGNSQHFSDPSPNRNSVFRKREFETRMFDATIIIDYDQILSKWNRVFAGIHEICM